MIGTVSLGFSARLTARLGQRTVLLTGLAVLSTLATARAAGLHAAGLGTPAALAGGYRLAFGVGAGLALAAIVLAAAVLRPRAAPAPDPLRPGAAAAADSARSSRRPAGRGMVAGPQGTRPCLGS